MISLQSLESGTENNFSSYETRKNAISNLKELIRKESSLIETLIIKEPIKEILSKRCELNDGVIRYVAEQFLKKDESKLNIIAVGGYGRGEFYPKSDTDLLILLDKNSSLKKMFLLGHPSLSLGQFLDQANSSESMRKKFF